MGTSCITINGNDLWLNDIDLSVVMALAANGPIAPGSSGWAQNLRNNWTEVKYSFAPGCIPSGIEKVIATEGEPARVAISLNLILMFAKANPSALSADSLNSLGIPGISFRECYPAANLERSVAGILQLLGFWKVPETDELVPTFPDLPRADKEEIARLGDMYEGGKAMRILQVKTGCSDAEAKLWVLYRARTVKL